MKRYLCCWLDAGVNAQDEHGLTSLHTAAARGEVEEVRRLVEAGADLDTRNTWGMTAARCAALGGNLDIVRRLQEHGADINIADQAATF